MGLYSNQGSGYPIQSFTELARLDGMTSSAAQIDAAATLAATLTSTPAQIDAAATLAATLTSTPAQIDAAATLAATDNTVVVKRGATDILSGTALVAAYTASKSLTPGGNALSATNRAKILVPSGVYDIGSVQFIIDTNYVDIEAVNAQTPHPRRDLDYDYINDIPSLDCFRPTNVLIKGTSAMNNQMVIQSAGDVRLIGLSFLNQRYGEGGENGTDNTDCSVYYITSNDNSSSLYEKCVFWQMGSGNASARTVMGLTTIRGTWIDCVSSSNSWRFADTTLAIYYPGLNAHMIRCTAGPRSWGGDNLATIEGIYENCKCLGYEDISLLNSEFDFRGFAGFGGCSSNAGAIINGTFIDCEAGSNSFAGVGAQFNGTAIRCKAKGGNSFGSINYGDYTGTLIDCEFHLDPSAPPAGINKIGTGAWKGTVIRPKIFGRSQIGTLSAVNEAVTYMAVVATAGEWAITIRGVSTGNIAFNANQAAIQSALNSAYGSNQVVVSGTLGDGFTLTFSGSSYAGKAIPLSMISLELSDLTLSDGYVAAGFGVMVLEGAPAINSAAQLADGDFAGKIINDPATPTIACSTSPIVVVEMMNGLSYSNSGATSSVTFNLPFAYAGLKYNFYKLNAQNLVIQANTDDTINGGTAGKAYQNVTAGETGAWVTLEAIDATRWIVKASSGTWANNNT